METGVEQLIDLLDVRTTLIKLDCAEDVVRESLRRVREQLQPQVASIFLFSKDGYIQRMGINGIDRNGLPIAADWFQDEKYKPGESFSGRAAEPIKDSGYGKPQWSNNLRHYKMKRESRDAYLEKLGDLCCGISVPLNGPNRTFGTLEVFNKVDQSNQLLLESHFTKDDVYWLTIIGMNVASAISHLRRKEELETFTNLTQKLVSSFDHDSNQRKTYKYIARQLITPLNAFKLCTIHLVNDCGGSDLAACVSTGDICQGKLNIFQKQVTVIIDRIIKSKSKEIVSEITMVKDEARDIKWMSSCGLESYACFPLLIEGEALGALSFFTGYKYEFYPSDVSFLQNISSLVAAFVERIRVTKQLQLERDKILSAARTAGYNNFIQSVLHQYQNELLSLGHFLEEIKDVGVPRRTEQAIDGRILLLQKRFDEIQREFESGDEPSAVNVNSIIQEMIRHFSLELRGRNIKFTFQYDKDIPDILVNEADIRDIFYNLISNSVRAIEQSNRKSGEIAISNDLVKIDRIQYIQVLVKDNGVGIKKELREKIFERGFTTSKEEGGTGKGLFVVREILNNYGGEITLESIVGKGTQFSVRIPSKRYEV